MSDGEGEPTPVEGPALEPASSPSAAALPLSPATFGRFLLGNRAAILTLAADQRAPWFGLAFVMLAALGREYDAEYLVAEPWHLLIGPAASAGAAVAVYLAVHLVGSWEPDARQPFLATFPRFLALFWLTAPLAWIYAVPFERFLSVTGAAEANLAALQVVALWRVLLMARVVAVLFGTTFGGALAPVVLVSAGLMQAALTMFPVALLAFMGGVRLGPADAVLASAGFTAFMLSLLGGGFAALVCLVDFVRFRSNPWRAPALPDPHPASARTTWIVTGALFLLALAPLPWTQREQRLRYEVEVAMGAGDFQRAFALLGAEPREAFPPHWDVPPRLGAVGNRLGSLQAGSPPVDAIGLVEALAHGTPPAWARAALLAKLEAILSAAAGRLDTQGPRRIERLLRAIDAVPERKRLIGAIRVWLELFVEGRDLLIDRGDVDRALVERLLGERGATPTRSAGE